MSQTIIGRVDQLAADLNVFKTQIAPADEAKLLRRLASGTAWVEQHCNRKFSAKTETRYFDGDGSACLVLRAPHELVSVTSITLDQDGDGTYELALTTVDYFLQPANEPPYMRIDVNPRSSLIGAWSGRVKITGVWGYSNDSEATGLVLSGTHAIGATTLTSTVAGDIALGETIELESEQVYISKVLTPVTWTMERAVNGTTAVEHAGNVSIRRRVYPSTVVEAVHMHAARNYRSMGQGGTQPGPGLFNPGGASGNSQVLKDLEAFRRLGFS